MQKFLLRIALILVDVLTALQPDLNPMQITCHRLGRHNPSNSRPIPIKVVLEKERDVINIIRNSGKLKSIEQYQNISVSYDRTPRQLAQYKQVRQELLERIDKGENNIKLRYVNGVPKIQRLN